MEPYHIQFSSPHGARDFGVKAAAWALAALFVPAAIIMPAGYAGAQQVPGPPAPQTKPGRAAIRRAIADGQQTNPLAAPRLQRRRAVQILTLFLQRGQKQPYIGEQTTQVLAGGLESKQIVKHQGPWQERIQFVAPPRMSGEVILQNAGRFLHYKPSDSIILEGVASPELFQGQVKEILQGIRDGRISIQAVGEQVVANRNASIVEIRTPEGGWRLWIDDLTGVRLKSEQLNAQGSVSISTYFTSIDYAPTFDPTDFNAGALPRVKHEASLPSGPPLANVQAAQQQLDFTVREPTLPAGFHLAGVWVVTQAGGRRVAVLRYTDGPNNFTLFEQLARPKQIALRPLTAPLRKNPRHWIAGDVGITLLGNVRPATLRQIADSIQ